jgi:hypothetical protein
MLSGSLKKTCIPGYVLINFINYRDNFICFKKEKYLLTKERFWTSQALYQTFTKRDDIME